MAGALLLVGDKYIASIGSTIISYSNLNDFPIFVISGEIPLVDIFEETDTLLRIIKTQMY